jgi:hypothetical protein
MSDSENPFEVLSGLPPLDCSQGAIPPSRSDAPEPEKAWPQADDLTVLFGPKIPVADILVRFLGDK